MNGLDPTQLKKIIIRPALEKLGLGGDSAVNLVLGTAIAESGLVYLQQRRSGPALGLFQMEPAAHDDIWKNYLRFRPELMQKVQAIAGTEKPQATLMLSNLAYAAVMCRLCYLRAKDKLPEANDAAAMAVYHKVHYNTSFGAAEASKNVPFFRSAISV